MHTDLGYTEAPHVPWFKICAFIFRSGAEHCNNHAIVKTQWMLERVHKGLTARCRAWRRSRIFFPLPRNAKTNINNTDLSFRINFDYLCQNAMADTHTGFCF